MSSCTHAFRSPLALPLLTTMLLLAGPLAAPARAQSWEKINPPSFVTADYLTVDGSDVVTVNGGGGTYWSTDAGKTWKGGNTITNPVTMTIGGEAANGLTRDGLWQVDANGDIYMVTMYMTTKAPTKTGKTLFKSSDHGFTWDAVIDSIPDVTWMLSANVFLVPGGNMYLLTNTPTAAVFSKILVSKDKGKTWTMTGSFKYVWNFAATSDGTLYAVAGKTGAIKQSLYSSKDDGATWDSLYTFDRNTAVHAIDVSPKGGVVVALEAMKVAAIAPGGTTVKVGDAVSGAGFGTACTLLPDGRVLIGAPYMGVKISDKDLAAFTTLNGGLGKDTAATTRLFKQDSKGNIYMIGSQDLFILRGFGASIQPLAGTPGLRPAAFRETRDLQGRRLGDVRPSRVWNIAIPEGTGW